jgi:DNA-binding FrmR family transcriptional regulator
MKADKAKVTRMLKTARGQLDGLLRMVDDDRYCIDISNQLLATEAILRRVNREVLRAHLSCCVAQALGGGDAADAQKKIDEMTGIIDKLSQ